MSEITQSIKFTDKLLKHFNIINFPIQLEQKIKQRYSIKEKFNNDFIFEKFNIIYNTSMIIKTYDEKILRFSIKYHSDEKKKNTLDLYLKENSKRILNIKTNDRWNSFIWNNYLEEIKARKIIIKLKLTKGVFIVNEFNSMIENISKNFKIIIFNNTNGNTSIFALIVNGYFITKNKNPQDTDTDTDTKYFLMIKPNISLKKIKTTLKDFMNQVNSYKIITDITEQNCKDDTCDCNKTTNHNYICCLCGHIKDITLNIIEEDITDTSNNITFLSSCGHTFHKICIQKYMEMYCADANHDSIICPLKDCNSTINQNILIRSQNKYYKYYKKYYKYKKKYINKKNILNII